MIWLINRMASLRGRDLGPTILKALIASLVMGLGLWGALPLLTDWLPTEGLIAEIAQVGILGLFGGGIYLLVLILLKAQELKLLSSLWRRFLPKR
jgi:peptidoglycan biosynthesis protein MviN/MurJ (putative lipid II flippase)